MKRYILPALAALTLAACTNDETTTATNGPVALKVNASIGTVDTRAVGTQWTDDDRIGISTMGTEGQTRYNNMEYVYSEGSGFTALTDDIYFQDKEEEVTFHAYYPFSGEQEEAPAPVEKTITADDQTAANQPEIDFLYASGATASSSEPTVSFTGDHAFTHRMSQITLTFIEGSDMDFGGSISYTLGDLKMDGTFNPLDGTAAADDDATATSLTVNLSEVQLTSGSYIAPSLILFPQEVTSIPITVTMGGQDYTATLSVKEGKLQSGNNYTWDITVTATLSVKDGKLQSGNNYTWKITVSKTDISVGKAEIKNWETVDNGGTTATM